MLHIILKGNAMLCKLTKGLEPRNCHRGMKQALYFFFKICIWQDAGFFSYVLYYVLYIFIYHCLLYCNQIKKSSLFGFLVNKQKRAFSSKHFPSIKLKNSKIIGQIIYYIQRKVSKDWRVKVKVLIFQFIF